MVTLTEILPNIHQLAFLDKMRLIRIFLYTCKKKSVKTSPILSIESKTALQSKVKGISKPMQMNIFDIGDPRLQRIKDALDKMDLNTMTPIELMMKVAEWKKMLDN